MDKTKKQPIEWEKILANDISDKGLVSKIYKELMKLNPQRTNNPIKKWAVNINRHFSKEDIQMANRHVKKKFKSLRNRKIKIKTTMKKKKTTMRYHLTSVRIANINKSGNDRCWQECRERATFLHS